VVFSRYVVEFEGGALWIAALTGVLFDRARSNLTPARYTPSIDYPGALATVLAFGDLIS
jgi:hypothetical protein